MMTLFKKKLGYYLLGLGSLFLLSMVISPLTEVPDTEEATAPTDTVTTDKVAADKVTTKVTTVAAGLIVGLPLSAVGGLLVVSASQERQLEHAQLTLASEDVRLRQVLYRLIEASDGQVTLVQFAIAADIPAAEARAYIDSQAKAFSANFDITDSGSIVYQFPIS